MIHLYSKSHRSRRNTTYGGAATLRERQLTAAHKLVLKSFTQRPPCSGNHQEFRLCLNRQAAGSNHGNALHDCWPTMVGFARARRLHPRATSSSLLFPALGNTDLSFPRGHSRYRTTDRERQAPSRLSRTVSVVPACSCFRQNPGDRGTSIGPVESPKQARWFGAA